jgi:hypothetical protein
MLTDQLWGRTLDRVAFDVTAQTLSLFVTVSDEDESNRHELLLSDVSKFQFVNAIPGPWDYAEATELHFHKDAWADQWRFEILLWSEDAGLSGRCRAVTVDGTDLTPRE